jgi:hypothetical protein
MTVGLFAAAGVVRKEKKIVAAFLAAGATSPERAATAAALGVHEGLAFRILRRRAVLREVAEQRLYLDEPSWEALQMMRRRLAFAISGIVLLVGILTFLWAIRR